MAKFKKRNKGGGGGDGGGMSGSNMVGILSQVIGGALMLFALILFQIAIGQLDTAYTDASTYDQVGLTDVMGIFGMVVFLVLIGSGIAVIAGGAAVGVIRAIRGNWIQVFLAFAMGAVALIIAFILNTIIQAQLNTAQVAINATTNIANFPGLYDISRIFGMLIFLVLVGSGIASITGSLVGAFKQIRSGF